MKYYERLQIHSSLSSYSSNDIFLYKEISEKEYLEKEKIDNDNVKQLTRRASIYYSEEKTCYTTKYSDQRVTEILKSLKKRYIEKGYQEDKPEILEKAIEDNIKAKKLLEVEKAKKLGKVLTGEFELEELTKNSYQGGFSDQLFENKIIQDYVSRAPMVWGYLGGYERLIEVDKKIEEEANKYLNKEDAIFVISNWVTSKSGRYFNDATDVNTIEDIKEIVESIDKSFIQEIVTELNEYEGYNIKLKENNIEFNM